MKVELLARAVRDLESIAHFVAADSPRGAESVSRGLADALGLIGEHPRIGRPIEGRALRLFVVPGLPYVMPYRLKRDPRPNPPRLSHQPPATEIMVIGPS